MQKILAVSGGVDSMVMLDIFAEKFPHNELIVAHFDHKMRDNSADDADFVKRRCRDYGIECVIEENSQSVHSEADARNCRYDFLRGLAKKIWAEEKSDQKLPIIYTAHHLDDLVGSVAINLIRGTGWRGLAALGAEDIHRPFLEDWGELGFDAPPTKAEIFLYAAKRELSFREDQSNSSDEYLRNRIYHQMNKKWQNCLENGRKSEILYHQTNNANYDYSPDELKFKVYELWQKQKKLREEIDRVILEILPAVHEPWQREWFDQLDDLVAMEFLRAGLMRAGISATRLQLADFLRAVREYLPGKKFNLPSDQFAEFRKNTFSLPEILIEKS